MAIPTKVPSLWSYQVRLQRKIAPHYSASFGDGRFTMQENIFLMAAMAKLQRLMLSDVVRKVPDDAIDIVGYLELFWQSFQARNRVPVRIRKELHR